MNTISKVSVAGVLALGFASAHASGIVVPGTSYAASDIMLFAEVLNGSTVLGSYVGDSQIATGTALTAGETLISTSGSSADAKLGSLLSLNTTGTTLEWAVVGMNYTQEGVNNAGDKYLTTQTAGAHGNDATISSATNQWSNILYAALQSAHTAAGTANSVLSSARLSPGWDSSLAPTATGNLSNWNGNGGPNNITGQGTTGLYLVTTNAVGNVTVSSALPTGSQVQLNTAGLSITSVPLPAAVWLLGSGLLGLAGVARRKVAV